MPFSLLNVSFINRFFSGVSIPRAAIGFPFIALGLICIAGIQILLAPHIEALLAPGIAVAIFVQREVSHILAKAVPISSGVVIVFYLEKISVANPCKSHNIGYGFCAAAVCEPFMQIFSIALAVFRHWARAVAAPYILRVAGFAHPIVGFAGIVVEPVLNHALCYANRVAPALFVRPPVGFH